MEQARYPYPSQKVFWKDYYSKIKHLVQISGKDGNLLLSARSTAYFHVFSGRQCALEAAMEISGYSLVTDLQSPPLLNSKISSLDFENLNAIKESDFQRIETEKVQQSDEDLSKQYRLVFVLEITQEHYTYIGFLTGRYFFPDQPVTFAKKDINKTWKNILHGVHKTIGIPPEIDPGRADGIYQYDENYYFYHNMRLECTLTAAKTCLVHRGFESYFFRGHTFRPIVSYYQYGFLKSEHNTNNGIIEEKNYSFPGVLNGRFSFLSALTLKRFIVNYENGYLSGPFELTQDDRNLTIQCYGNFRRDAKRTKWWSFIKDRHNNNVLYGLFDCIETSATVQEQYCERYNGEGQRHGPQIKKLKVPMFDPIETAEHVRYFIDGMEIPEAAYRDHYSRLFNATKQTQICSDLCRCIVEYLK